MKHNNIEEMIDLIEVKPSDKPGYQGALDRLKTIDLAYVSKVLKPEQLEYVSDYSIFDYPELEMMGDIETLQKLIDASKSFDLCVEQIDKSSDEMLKEIGLDAWIGNNEKQSLYDDEENDKLNTYVSFNKNYFIDNNNLKLKNEVEISFYPEESIDFDKFIAAVKKKMEEEGLVE